MTGPSRRGGRLAKAAAKRGRSRGSSSGSSEEGLLASVGAEAAGLALLFFSLVATLSLATHSPYDPVLQLTEVENLLGSFGATISGGLMRALGNGSFVLVASMAVVGGRLVLGRGLPPLISRFWLASPVLVVVFSTLPPLIRRVASDSVLAGSGGMLGNAMAGAEALLLSGWGAIVVNGLLLAIAGLATVGISTGQALATVGSAAATTGRVTSAAALVVADAVRRAGLALTASARGVMQVARDGAARLTVWREQRARRERVSEKRGPEIEDPIAEAVRPAKPAPGQKAETPERSAAHKGGGAGVPDIVDHEVERSKQRKPEQEAFEFRDEGPAGPFQLPDVSIFARPPSGERSYDRDSLLMNSRILEKKLADFGVEGRVVRVHPGPVITMYEFEPAPGIKVGRIVNLTDDLTMALRAISIRIIAPLPGKSVVGIEVPNARRDDVYLRTILESDVFRKHASPLAVAMGMDIFGAPTVADLSKMPHLLVAGSTGTGKSVFLNAFLCSLLCRTTPDQLKLLLVDPKLLELSIYEGIPHLIADVVTNPKRAAAALQGIVRKMEERYQMMSSVQVRNISQFNEKAREMIEAGEESFQLKPRQGETETQEVPWAEMPYIVVVIDELADLMVMVAKDVEESLQRLAQMARAAGIHLVLATQRPSVDVLTGVIKANFPSRVSFQVSSSTDSRTILDQKGADNLLGMGDMLFLPPGTSVLQRVHGSFVSEKEVVELVAYLREQGKPVFDEELVKFTEHGPDSPGTNASGEEVDEMYDQAIAIVAETRNASISYVQRRLKIGYNRAARIIEQMENDGMIGPQVGTRPREVFLRSPDEQEAE